MRLLLLALFFIIPGLTFSQEKNITGQVISISDEPLSGARIIDVYGSDLCPVTDVEGRFAIVAEIGSRFGVELEGYEIQWSVISDTDNYTIRMETKTQAIESIMITEELSEEALDIKNVNIIDFKPVGDYILTIKKNKNDYYLGLDKIQGEGQTYLLNMDKPEEFYFDCMNNTYILTRDSAYQFILFDYGLEFINVSDNCFRKIQGFKSNL
jgi:hypothetical protein